MTQAGEASVTPQDVVESGGAAEQSEPSELLLRRMRPHDQQEWDAFVLQHLHGSPFHMVAWKHIIEESFGYKPVYLLARDAGGIRGILPLFYIRNPIIGRALISSPFAVYGGILADSDIARTKLHELAKRLGTKLSVDYIELRNAFPEQCAGTPNVSRYVTFTQELTADEDALLASLPKKTRNIIRKSQKQSFVLNYQVSDPTEFISVHSRSMRRLGTPNFPRRYFESILAHFGKMVEIREVRLDSAVVAVSLSFLFRDQVHIYYAATDVQYNALAPNTFMYHDYLRWAGDNGFRVFDFGRSKRGTGTFEFKKHWNTTMRELPYEVILIKRKDLPNFSPTNPRFHLAIKIWQQIPLPITRLISRFVLRLFP